MSKDGEIKTAQQYKLEAYEIQGDVVRNAASMSQDDIMSRLTRMAELSRLAGMAEVCERANSLFHFEAKVAR